jgi:hypothetical protein
MNTAIAKMAVGRTQAGMAQDAFQSGRVDRANMRSSDETVKLGKLLDADILDASTRLELRTVRAQCDADVRRPRRMSLSLVDKL